MRISKVIGKVTLNKQVAGLAPGSYLIVRTLNRGSLAGKNGGNAEELVAYDNLGAREDDRIGLVEGREAAVAFGKRRVPYDSYNACILDEIDFRPILEVP
jgi:microcompartment protein CcmK/EutM